LVDLGRSTRAAHFRELAVCRHEPRKHWGDQLSCLNARFAASLASERVGVSQKVAMHFRR